MIPVLTVAGKVDSRVVVYPLLYMLKNFGRVLVVTDDAAYRRLYHGYEDAGEVSGVGICVSPNLDVDALSEEVSSFAPDYIVCVTSGRVPEFTTHLLVLTGYDRSLAGGNAHTKSELEQGVTVTLDESDVVKAPQGLSSDNIREVIVASTPVKSTLVQSICLRDGLLTHAALCEEYKSLVRHDSRDFVGVLAKIFCPFFVPTAESDVPKLFGFKK